jgi:tetratricopeptide (TPR) repeat protein
VDSAIISFQKARQLDPKLRFDSEQEAANLAKALSNESRWRLGETLRTESAMASFRKAKALDTNSEYAPIIKELGQVAAGLFVQEGEYAAQDGDMDGAVVYFKNALELDPKLNIDPNKKAEESRAEFLVEKGEELADDGDIEGAEQNFRQALELDPTLKIDPNKEARSLAMWGLFKKANELIKKCQIREAQAMMAQAQKFFEAEFAQKDADFWNPDSSMKISYYWNNLCWWGSLCDSGKYVRDFMEACNLAVNMKSEENRASSLDTRGLALALIGDYKGAIADFEAFVKYSRTSIRWPYEKYGRKREKWIAELKAGRNPFDQKTLEELREEE